MHLAFFRFQLFVESGKVFRRNHKTEQSGLGKEITPRHAPAGTSCIPMHRRPEFISGWRAAIYETIGRGGSRSKLEWLL